MKNLSFVAVALTGLSIAACSTNCGGDLVEATGSVSGANSNITVLQAAQSLTDGIFAKAAPSVTSAVQNLPESTQVMVQTAFAALQKGIDEAESVGWGTLSTSEQSVAQGALQMLQGVQDSLHAAIHDPNAIIPPTMALQDPNGLAIAVPVPVADPNVTVAVDPNTVASVTTAAGLLATDPCARIVSDPNALPTPTAPLLVAP